MVHRHVLASAVHAAEGVVELARCVGEMSTVRADGDAAAQAHEALRRAAQASFRGKDVLRAGPARDGEQLRVAADTIEAIALATRELQALLARLPSE